MEGEEGAFASVVFIPSQCSADTNAASHGTHRIWLDSSEDFPCTVMAARKNSHTVVKRISEELRAQVHSSALPAGTRMPSVRQLARERDISTFTAAEIYNVLVAAGVLEARRGLGYFVPEARRKRGRVAPTVQIPADALWEHRRASSGRTKVDAGCGWLPADWHFSEGIRRALRAVARQSDLGADGYGNPFGLGALRTHLVSQIQQRGIDVTEEQIVLTQGASQALDLIVRHCLSPGDTVVVEDPGYPPLFELLRAQAVKMLPVPRENDGPDLEALGRLLKSKRPRWLFTNTTVQNPTGTSTRTAVAYRLLELANQFDFNIVEDDIFADLAPRRDTSLASLDQVKRVCYISSLSKTVAPDLRVGYLVASRALAEKLARAKVTTSLASSELMERLALQILTDGHYRRHLERLRARLAQAQMTVAQALEARGVELAFRPQTGMFLWGKLPSRNSVGRLWQRALEAQVLLAPGELFRPDGQATPFWRFNVAHCDSPRLYSFLDTIRTESDASEPPPKQP